MRKLTVDEAFDLLRFDTEGRFFSVTTERRTDRADRSQVAGDLRTMLCKAAGTMSRYKRGIIPDEVRDREDAQHGLITVWSLDAFMRYRRGGNCRKCHGPCRNMGEHSFRRVDLMGLRHPQAECSVIDADELPITYRPALHHVTNEFRAANMPRRSRAR
jgi:hypothetical protein